MLLTVVMLANGSHAAETDANPDAASPDSTAAQPRFAPYPAPRLAVVLTDEDRESAWWNAMSAALDNFRAGNLLEAERQWMIAADYARGFGPETLRLATTLSNLGELYRDQGRVYQAKPLLEQALEIRELRHDGRHREIIESLSALADLSLRLGRPGEAAERLKRARALAQSMYGPLDMGVATLVTSQGVVALEQGYIDEAADFHRLSLSIREKLLSADHLEVGLGLYFLGQALDRQGNIEAVLPLYERALGIWEAQLGDHPRVADLLIEIAALKEAVGDMEAAVDLYARAGAIEEAVSGSAHPRLARTLSRLATLHHLLEDYAVAEEQYGRAIEIWTVVHGPRSPELVQVLRDYAQLLRETARTEQATQVEARAREIWDEIEAYGR